MGFHFDPLNLCGFIIFFLFGLWRLLCDLWPDISIASISTAVHAPWKLEGGGPNFWQSTSFWYIFLNSKMLLEVDLFSAGFTPQSWVFINYFCPLIEVWNLPGLFTLYATSLLPCKGYGVHNFSLIRTHLFSQNRTCSGHARFFLLQNCNKLFVFFSLERRETGHLPGENNMFVCAIILLFENRFIFLACLPQPAS